MSNTEKDSKDNADGQWFQAHVYRVPKPLGSPLPWMIMMGLNIFVTLGILIYIALDD